MNSEPKAGRRRARRRVRTGASSAGTGRRGTSGATAPGVDSSRMRQPAADPRDHRAREREPGAVAQLEVVGRVEQARADQQDRDPAEGAGDHRDADRLRRAARRDARRPGRRSRAPPAARAGRRSREHLPRRQVRRRRRDAATRRIGVRSPVAAYQGRNSETSSSTPPRPASGSARRIRPGSGAAGRRGRRRRASTRRAAQPAPDPRDHRAGEREPGAVAQVDDAVGRRAGRAAGSRRARSRSSRARWRSRRCRSTSPGRSSRRDSTGTRDREHGEQREQDVERPRTPATP